MITTAAIGVFLGAIVAGNLLAAHYGAWITPWVGFVLIGLDLTLRDLLHQKWQDQGALRRNMVLLIAAGGILSALVNHAAARIALASGVAFAAEATVATVVYWRLFKWPRLRKMAAANCVGAAVDSLTFIPLAFGALLPGLMLMQFAFKFGGGSLWAWALIKLKK